MLYEIAAMGALNTLYAVHMLLLIGANYKCNGLCVRVQNEGSRVTLHVSYGGQPLDGAVLHISVNGQTSTFTTNDTGGIAFFAPLKLGANHFTAGYAKQSRSFEVYYLGGMGGLMAIPIGAVLLLAVVRVADFKNGNRSILLHFNADEYPDARAANLQKAGHEEGPLAVRGNSEPYTGIIAEGMISGALTNGAYHIGDAKTASRFMAANDVIATSSIRSARSFKGHEHVSIAVLNAYERKSVDFNKYINSDTGCIMLYLHAIGSLEVIEFFGS
ncbi:MAG: hypothetical protein ACP5UH_00875 [Candidatus Micrarchaeia archaeon]